MKKILCILSMVSLILSSLPGCMPFALRLSPSLIPNFASSIFEECDPELARMSLPAHLKLMEGLLNSDPGNKRILTALSMGFAGYSQLFIEAGDPERASDLYQRAREYGVRAMGERGAFLSDFKATVSGVHTGLRRLERQDFEALFWMTLAWNAWINLNLDKPEALAQLAPSQVCLHRVMELNPDYLHGLPQILMGVSLAARSPLFGGNIEEARSRFEKALALGHRRFFLAQYYFARYYAVRTQDKALFTRLLHEIVDGDPHGLKEICLMNVIIQQKTNELLARMDELFL